MPRSPVGGTQQVSNLGGGRVGLERCRATEPCASGASAPPPSPTHHLCTPHPLTHLPAHAPSLEERQQYFSVYLYIQRSYYYNSVHVHKLWSDGDLRKCHFGSISIDVETSPRPLCLVLSLSVTVNRYTLKDQYTDLFKTGFCPSDR